VLNIAELIDSVQEVSPSAHNVNRINSIADHYKKERQESKTPTFALTL
jgi:hypothetical protein